MCSTYTVPLAAHSLPVLGWPEVRDYPCLLWGQHHRPGSRVALGQRGFPEEILE